MRDLDWSDVVADGERNDLEQYEVAMLRRDNAIDQYDDWWYNEGAIAIALCRFETLLSWKQFEQECPRCGAPKRTVKTDRDQDWYELSCKHYVIRWDKHFEWDDEIGWVPKGSFEGSDWA